MNKQKSMAVSDGTVKRKKRPLKDFFIQMLRPSENNEVVNAEKRGIDGYVHHKKLIEFKIYFANGGTIIETCRYNQQTGNQDCELHVIKQDNSIGESIDKILTFEGMK